MDVFSFRNPLTHQSFGQPHSRHFLGLSEDANGEDLGERDSAIDVSSGFGDLWPAIAGYALARINVAGQPQQPVSQYGRVAIMERPLLGRQRDERAPVAAPDPQGQVVGGHLRRRRQLPVRLLYAAQQQSTGVVCQKCIAKPSSAARG